MPKFNIIRSEVYAFDILVFSESWLKANIADDTIQIENFKPPFRKDRVNCIGGGVTVYVRDTTPCKRRIYLEIRHVEAGWVECKMTLVVGGFFKPHNSTPDYFELLKENKDRACNTHIIKIIITGYFNCSMTQWLPNKMSELMSEYNLRQLISEDTHFTEHSSSLSDLILVRNDENILISIVIDPLIPEQVRYHCHIMVLLKFTPPRATSFKRKTWCYKLAEYTKYRELLSKANLENIIQSNDNKDQNF